MRARSIVIFERANHVKNSLNLYPRLGLRRYPSGGAGVALKGLNSLQYAIRPLGFNDPKIAVAKYYVKEWLFGVCAHLDSIATIGEANRRTRFQATRRQSSGHAAYGPSSVLVPRPLRSCFIWAIASVMASASLRRAGCKYPALMSLAIISRDAARKGD